MKVAFALLLAATLAPSQALAWGSEGHILIAALARSRLTPATLAKVDAILAQDKDASTPSDMLSRSVWADVYRAHGHRETAPWHFADVELDHPDLDAACFGHPSLSGPASTGAAQDCIVDKLNQFTEELGSPGTDPAERILALKYVLHLVGDLHQPLHLADNHDRGGNCVQISLGRQRTANLHGYWDGIVVSELGADARAILARMESDTTPERAAEWSSGGIADWAMETNAIAVDVAYAVGTKPGCASDTSPVDLPTGYDTAARQAALTQLERGGVRLAVTLEQSLGKVSLDRLAAR